MDLLVYMGLVMVGLVMVAFALWSIKDALKNLKNSPENSVVYFQFPSVAKAIEEINSAISRLGGNQQCEFNAENEVLELYCEVDQNSGKKSFDVFETSDTDFFYDKGQIIFKLVLDEDCLLLLLWELERSNHFTKRTLTKGIESYYVYDPEKRIVAN